VRFLFSTIQGFESDFYGRVGRGLVERGHEVAHVTYSRRAARRLRERGAAAESAVDRMAALGELDVGAESRRIERRYSLASIREAYWTDPVCERRSERWCIDRTVRHFLALEQLFDEVEPEVLVPEVGCELLRTVAHLVALDRGVPTFFLFYTIFPEPLRLYVDTMHAPIVPHDDLRPLTALERAEVERFIREFTTRAEPIRAHRSLRVTKARLQQFGDYLAARAQEDRGNEYLTPGRWLAAGVRESARRPILRLLYDSLQSSRPFVYFPLHVSDDYKIKSVIPHCRDQAAIVEQLADALPAGVDLVLKEHPLSVGRNPLGLLRRLQKRRNVRLVHPSTSSHELIARSRAVAVISSTVGLEATLYGKPVLTLGQPFYSGYGITLDLDSFAEIRRAMPALLEFEPDPDLVSQFVHAAMGRCYPGKPVMVDRSDDNAASLASSLDAAASALQPVAQRPGASTAAPTVSGSRNGRSSDVAATRTGSG
jgi:hypothetical protein